MAGRLQGMVAIVTGSASGIGRACAVALGLEGASVVVADLDADGAVAVADHIVEHGGRAHAVRVDLGDAESVEALVQQTVDRFGGLDILHNNAAATHLAATRDLNVGDMDPDVWDATMRINLKGTMLATKFALPHLVAGGGGSIVNTSQRRQPRGRPGPHGVRGVEGCDQRAHPQHGRAVRQGGSPLQRHRSRPDRHAGVGGQLRGTERRHDAAPPPHVEARRARRHRRDVGLPVLTRGRASSPARSSASTVGRAAISPTRRHPGPSDRTAGERAEDGGSTGPTV